MVLPHRATGTHYHQGRCYPCVENCALATTDWQPEIALKTYYGFCMLLAGIPCSICSDCSEIPCKEAFHFFGGDSCEFGAAPLDFGAVNMTDSDGWRFVWKSERLVLQLNRYSEGLSFVRSRSNVTTVGVSEAMPIKLEGQALNLQTRQNMCILNHIEII